MQIQPNVGCAFMCACVCVCMCVCVCARPSVSLSVIIAAPLTRFSHTMGRMTIKSTRSVLGHSLVHSLIHSHPTLIRSFRTVRFACALRCVHFFVRSLAHSLAPELMGKGFLSVNRMRHFQAVSTHCAPRVCVCMCVYVCVCV